MSNISDDEGALRRYLLGQLQEAEQAPIEERMLVDDDYFEQLQMAEAELIDEYISGAMPEPDRQSFTTHFLGPRERQKKMRVALAIARYAALRTGPASKAHQQPRSSTTRSRLPRLIVALTSKPRFALVMSVSVLLVVAGLGALYFTLESPRVSAPTDDQLAKLNQKDLSDLSEYADITRLALVAAENRDTTEIRTLLLSDTSDVVLMRLAVPSGLTAERVKLRITCNSETKAYLEAKVYTGETTRDARLLIPRAELGVGRYSIEINDIHNGAGAIYVFDVEP